jgi:beta-aspartyl-peptidase (threonine type)
MRDFNVKEWYDRIAAVWHGTVDVVVGDKDRELCCGVSTSGLALKLPGRVGDTPVIGAGNYADARYGAAACVGQGELAIRITAARQAVDRLAAGRSPRQAADAVIRDALRVDPKGILQVLVVDPKGRAAASASQRNLHTVYWREGMADVERRPSKRIEAR